MSDKSGVDYKEHLRRLALHDVVLVRSLTAADSPADAALEQKTAALVCVAATIAVDAATASIQHAVELALSAGATKEEIVATLEMVTPIIGTPLVVSSASKIGLALGYDVDDALHELDP